MEQDIKKIREAVCANCGGFGDATDVQIRAKWNSLPEEVQKQYLESIEKTSKKRKEKNDATGDKAK